MMNTRSQTDLSIAIKLVNQIAAKPDKGVRDAYGRLCHSFPVMVRTCGLCQAVAFSAAKGADASTGANEQAHRLLLDHVAEVIGLRGRAELLSHTAGAPVERYMQDTAAVLRTWIYFKRLAVSMLEVGGAQEAGS